MRLVGHHICVSCWNRQREYLLGRNAKGAAPKMHPKLFAAQVRVLVGGKTRVAKRSLCASVDEVVIGELRDQAKRVLFSFSPMVSVSWVQQELPL